MKGLCKAAAGALPTLISTVSALRLPRPELSLIDSHTFAEQAFPPASDQNLTEGTPVSRKSRNIRLLRSIPG